MDKKNTLLLTVIAVATLLVAIVGATFAYFTAQLGGGKTSNITVQTETSDTTTFLSFGDLSINANQTNFGEEEFGGVAGHSLYAETTGTVNFTSSQSSGQGKNYCYKVGLEVSNNTFDYSLAKTRDTDKNYPELILRLYKDEKEYGTDSTLTWADSLAASDDTTFSTASTPSGEITVPYVKDILESTDNGATICKDTVGNAVDEKDCLKDSNVSGYDITVLGNSASGSDANYKAKKVLLIPSASSDYEHKLTAAEAGGTDTDSWKVQVVFVNYSDEDISGDTKGDADQNTNTNKNFKAYLKFLPLQKCTD